MQSDTMDCGPACLRMIAKYYGKDHSLQSLCESALITEQGVSLKNLNDAAVKIGFSTIRAELSFEQLDDEIDLPCILHWHTTHFIVLPPQDYNRYNNEANIVIIDPACGMVEVSKEVFLESWMGAGNRGFALLLEPTPFFYDF